MDDADRMVVIDGTRYRIEDAKRLGLIADPPTPPEAKQAPKPKNKARRPRNKSTDPDD